MKILKFGAEWCQPCKSLDKVLEQISNDGFDVEKIDIGEDPEKAAQYGVRSIPTTFIMDESNNVKEVIMGAITYENLKSKLIVQ